MGITKRLDLKVGFSCNNRRKKFPQYKLCKFDLICEGPWKEYPDKFGDSEFRADQVKNKFTFIQMVRVYQIG